MDRVDHREQTWRRNPEDLVKHLKTFQLKLRFSVSVISPEQAEAALYTLKMYGYRGYFGIDINPERMPAQVAPRNNMDAPRASAASRQARPATFLASVIC